MSEVEERRGRGRVLFAVAMILLVLAAVLIVASTLFFPVSGTGYPYGSRMMGGGFYGWMAIIPLLFFLFFVLLLAAMLSARPYSHPWMHAYPMCPGASARELLDHRYASGEITREQYIRMKDDLGGSASLHA